MPFCIAWSRTSGTVTATLWEQTLIEGRPASRRMCRLAAIGQDWLDDIAEADRFWHHVRQRLGRLQRLSGRDRDGIEAALAQRVPKPAPAPPPVTVHRSGHPVRGPFAPLTRSLRAR
ncbi:hypothetical protein [Bradyrhizobium monzae]|uniref:hypothetical protein n=1 Tax=Bradyrhizobium sp. Oc8 TaxID=2876780 RepID=UPI001F2A1A4C|nr:hypothetical protein [Bradyrhizobium sp. Oc8]